MGRRLAREHPVEADLVIPTPESGTPAAIGYAQESGIPFGQGLVKNSYVGRTFIQPSQTIRQLGIRLKLNPLERGHQRQAPGRRRRLDRARQHPARAGPDAARGRRGRGARAHLLARRCTWPCFYGIDFATRAELIATGLGVEEIRASRSAPTPSATSREEGMIAATEPAARPRCARPASPASTRSSCRDARPARQEPAGAPLPASSSVAPLPTARPRRRRRATGVGGGSDALEPALTPSATPSAGASRRVEPLGATTERLRVRAVTYAAAGVDIEAGDRAVELMKASVGTHPAARRCSAASAASPACSTPRALTALTAPAAGHLAPTASAPRSRSRRRMDKHDTIGFDLVGMVVDDIVVVRRRAAVHDRLHRLRQGRARADRRRSSRGIAEACAAGRHAPWSAARPPSTPGCSGRTSTTSPAPPPAWSRPTTCSAPTGSAPATWCVALASSRPALQRLLAGARACSPRPGWALDRDVAELGRTLGEELLEPTRIYARDLLDLVRADGVDVHALSHVTGGGLAANLARVLPRGSFAPGRPLDLDPAAGLRRRAASSAGCRWPTSSGR